MQPTTRRLALVALGVLAFKVMYFAGSFLALDLTHQIREPAAQHFAMWDGWHYLRLSTIGYIANDESCRFFPLFPLCISSLAPLVGGSHLAAGLLLSNLFSLVAFVLFNHGVYSRFGESTANWSLVFLLAFPGALFYQMVYSESLFFLLLILTWTGLEQQRYRWVAVWAILLPLCRPNGVFIALPILWYLARDKPMFFLRLPNWLRDPSSVNATEANLEKTTATDAWSNLRYYALLLSPLWGWGCYLTLMWVWTGNPWVGFDTQLQSHSVWNLINVPKFIVSFFTVTRWHEFESSFLERCIFIAVLCTVTTQWRLDKGFFVWSYMLGLLPAMSGEYNSFTRYVAPAFPVFIAFGAWLGQPNRFRVRWSVLYVFGVLHLVLLWRYLNFKWAG